MTVNKAASIEEYKIAGRFESLRKVLKSEKYSRHLEKPLAYWALPTDRRLPLVLLGRTLNDLLEMPFAELAATPGIGQKKIRSFVELLARVTDTDASDLAQEDINTASIDASRQKRRPASSQDFDPSSVSEVVWSQWRATVVKHGLQRETLGRLAPSLRRMTRACWNMPLGAFTEQTLEEIKARKTHGEKRINALLEVFCGLHNMLSEMSEMEHLVVRICPQRIDAVQQWIQDVMQSSELPDKTEIFQKFIKPLLDQIHLDAAEKVAHLADDRVGMLGPIVSVRELARRMGLTRARIYQRLNEINDIMQVRWPSGRVETYALQEKLCVEATAAGKSEQLVQFRAAVELFYPSNRRGGVAFSQQMALSAADDVCEALIDKIDPVNPDVDSLGV